MKRIATSLLLALSVAVVQAQSPATPVTPEAPVARAAPAAPVAAAEDAPPAEPAPPTTDAPEETVVMAHERPPETPRHCLRDTGTRIKRRDRDGCTNGIGESYSGEELRRTGARDTAEALRLLSPRFGG